MDRHRNSPNETGPWPRGRVIVLGALCGLILLLTWQQRKTSVSDAGDGNLTAGSHVATVSDGADLSGPRRFQRSSATVASLPAELVVSNKLAQFARSRRDIAHALARRAHVEVPPDVERYFAALEAHRWEEADALFDAWVQERRSASEDNPPTVPNELWAAIFEAQGVAETARQWDPQKLLDYGEAILSALRPGMVYVGGTDPGRYIPTLLNETSEGERHVVLTQNALADGTYLKYLEFLHSDRLQMLTSEDSQQAFSEYLREAQARLARNQLRPGENVRVNDNRVEVSGQVAVMGINEGLLNRLTEKNPGVSFALEESFPLKTTYAGALPLGPILELRASPEPPSSAHVAASLEQWRSMAQSLSTDAPDSDVRKTYAHMAQAQGNLLAERGLTAAAEQTWRLALEMFPASPEATGALYRMWQNSGRGNEAEALLNTFARSFPDQVKEVEMIRASGVALSQVQ